MGVEVIDSSGGLNAKLKVVVSYSLITIENYPDRLNFLLISKKDC
jgi:hypothetical protein